ncbi:MAG: sulfite exporter TauE/SafE family protein [Chitinophagaceae bacterium]
MWQIIFSGLMIGLISSFHCVGMCGAIAFSLPVQYLPPQLKLLGIILYNLGRVTTYGLLGLFFGFVGRQFFVGGMQQLFSIALGICILLFLALSKQTNGKYTWKPIAKFNNALQNFIINYIQKKQLYGLFIIGLANGLLPCGMVYFAITGAMATGSLQGGVSFMVAFGLGTLPLMALLSQFGFIVGLNARNFIKKSIPFFAAAMAVLLILRGLNLGIPYVSPILQNTGSSAISCH